ncbi:MAG TPA: chitobiase/beta-hexosaminidase C-terminal domain-containing protein [Opitutaceae bacterium]|nr:chitobiase/beta-hexosaminidase C-terminal domain-containing protein [Opitutaceae bacterium]
MKFLVVSALLAASCWRAEASGTWTPLANQAPENIAHMLLLTDGTVIISVVDSGNNPTNHWYRLTPDLHGSYVNGTWTPFSSMNDARLYYASQVMNNGDVFVAGGEYGDPGAATSAEVWDSQSNTWSLVPNTNYVFVDAISKLLPSGKVLVKCARGTVIYDPVSNTSTPGAAPLNEQDEIDWVQLPDESILTVDGNSTEVDRYIPSVNQWAHDTATPVNLFSSDGEIGSFNLLPNGKVLVIGGAPVTAIYTPSGSTNPGTWVQGPNIPNNLGANDAPAASMFNGKILMAVGPTGTFNPPISFYEYDYVANTLTQVNGPTGIMYDAAPPFVSGMLALPDGSILFSVEATQCYVYQPDGTPLAAGKPSIQTLTTNSDGSYHLTGTGFNGISEGAKYGDDAQMDTNWPIVRLKNNVSGNVYYAKTFGWTPGVVATGTTPVATDFSVPAGLPAGTYALVVVANGNSSDPVAFPPSGLTAATPTFSPPAGTYASAQTVTITTTTSGASIRYTTDGSTPTETNGALYAGPVSIATTTTLQAMAYESGYADSAVASGTYTIGSSCISVSSSNGFDNIAMSSSQSGTFTATFDASPSLSPSNAVIGLSKGTQTAYTGLSCIARFNTSGDIDAYNGTAYQAASVIPYAKNTTYHFRMVVNVPANTYSVYVTPPGGSELTVGLNYKFRSAVTSLDTWTIDVNATPGGSVTVCNLSGSGSGGTVAAPSFSPGAGTYSTAQTVLINDSTSGASIRYTTDGSAPSETAGILYTGSISISATTKLEAIAYKTGMTDSPVTTGNYTIPPIPSAPVFSPGAGTYTSMPTVTITSSGASSIYYTTDGSLPISSSTLYTGPILISSSMTLEAIGTNNSGTSPFTTGQYTLNLPQVAPPTFTPPTGTYTSAQTVTITSATSGASIVYTTDGSIPTERGGTVTHGTPLPNGGSFTISTSGTLDAMAYKFGMNDSNYTPCNYTISPTQVAAPTFSPGAGTYTNAQAVTITSATSGASIAYTTDGTTPTESGGTVTHGTPLSNGGSVTISTTAMLKAMAFEVGLTDSTMTSGQYTISQTQVATPTFSPAAGTYTSPQTVTITTTTSGASIRYTTDGSTPTETAGTLYSSPVTISTTTTIRAIAYKTGMTDSTVTSVLYTISPTQVAAPTFSPAAGTYTSPQTITITTTTSGASIRYTTDGSTPTETAGTLYSSPVSISTTTTLKAIAYETGMTDSTVTTGQYTITSGRSLTGTSSDGWHALALTSAQTGTFTATFDATPTISPENAVVGLSKGVATAYTGLSCIARFNTSGDIDAYNGTAYQAASIIPYAKNTAYHFRMVVNVPAHTYSVYVTPPGQSELTVGLNYAFRVTQMSLDTWNLDVNATPSGCSLTANNLNP